MEKLETQTGLIKKPAKKPSATARRDSSGKAGKVSNKKAAKQRKTAKLKEKKEAKPPKEKKKRKQGGKGRPYQAKGWEAYAPKGPAATSYTREELEQIVRRAAGAANRRLQRLEEKGETNTPAYKRAQKMLATQGRNRFSGAVRGMTRNELIAEYMRLRDFINLKTSTAAGLKDWKNNIYNSLLDRGFEGSKQEISDLFDKYMTKQMEEALGSDVVYTLLQTEEGRPFLQRAQDAIEYAKTAGIDQREALAMEFNIQSEKQAAQILAQYFGG